MPYKKVLVAVALLLAATAQAETLCGMSTQQYKDCVRLVDSLRPDKGGQARVFATDGSEFTAAQALWMQGQLRKFDRLCTRDRVGDEAEAARTLAGIRELLDSHQRRS